MGAFAIFLKFPAMKWTHESIAVDFAIGQICIQMWAVQIENSDFAALSTIDGKPLSECFYLFYFAPFNFIGTT